MMSWNKCYLYTLLILVASFINFVLQEYIINENLLVESFKEKISYEAILQMINAKEDWGWMSYLLLPFIYLIKLNIIALWILCGAIIFGYKVRFSSIFQVVLIAEFIWFLPSISMLIWFSIFDLTYTFNDVQFFAPLSLLSLFDISSLEPWLIFPLKALNLFEVFYMLILALGIKKLVNQNYDSALKFTLPVYGSALVVWILFITFLSINLGV